MSKIKDFIIRDSLYTTGLLILILAIGIEYLSHRFPLADFWFVNHDNNINFQILLTSTVTLMALNLSMFGILTQVVKSDQKFLGVRFIEAFSQIPVFTSMNIKDVSVLEFFLFIFSYVFYSYLKFNAMTFTCLAMITIVLNVIITFWNLVYKKEYFYESCYNIIKNKLISAKLANKDNFQEVLSFIQYDIDKEFDNCLKNNELAKTWLLVEYTDMLCKCEEIELSFFEIKFKIAYQYHTSDYIPGKKLTKTVLNQILNNNNQYDKFIELLYNKIITFYRNESFSKIVTKKSVLDFIEFVHNGIFQINNDYLIEINSYQKKYFLQLYFNVFDSIYNNVSLKYVEKSEVLKDYMHSYSVKAYRGFFSFQYMNTLGIFSIIGNLYTTSKLLISSLVNGDYTLVRLYQKEVAKYKTYGHFSNYFERSNQLLALIWGLLIKSQLFEMHDDAEMILKNYLQEKIYIKNNEIDMVKAAYNGIDQIVHNDEWQLLKSFFNLLIEYSHDLQQKTGHVYSQNYNMPITLVALVTLVSSSISNVKNFDFDCFDHKRSNFKMCRYFENLRSLCNEITQENYLAKLESDDVICSILEIFKIRYLYIDDFKSKVNELYEFFDKKISSNQ